MKQFLLLLRQFKNPLFLLSLLFSLILVYTRFVNLGWGLPYPMHPDERNMAIAVIQLRCVQFPSSECFNPHFFAYGQLTIYLAYLIAIIPKYLSRQLDIPISYTEAVMGLRYIAAFASLLTYWLMVRIVLLVVKNLYKKNDLVRISASGEGNQTAEYKGLKYFIYPLSLLFIFSPGLIQFAHFGTTESLLMMFNVLIIYLSLLLLMKKLPVNQFILLAGIAGGLALATKVSALVFFFVPTVALGWYTFGTVESRRFLHYFFYEMNMLATGLLFFILFSPFNFISLPEFLGSMIYESDVATGKYVAFYIRQFEGTIPVIFQFMRIFPYAIGTPVLFVFGAAFLFLPFNRIHNLLRLAFLSYFIPTAFLFAKWTRFMSPLFPVMLILASLFISDMWYKALQIAVLLKKQHVLFAALIKGVITILFFSIICICTIHGIAYLSVYKIPDIRFTASEWIYRHITPGTKILSETANVVDLPVPAPFHPKSLYEHKYYDYISFDFYNVDDNFLLQDKLEEYVNTADYIFIPSRRVFMNHTCLDDNNRSLSSDFLIEKYKQYELIGAKDLIDQCRVRQERYMVLNGYYQRLFSGSSGFSLIEKFTSYPKIQLFGKTLVEFPDEQAEESWTVFDHPVFRIYKRTN